MMGKNIGWFFGVATLFLASLLRAQSPPATIQQWADAQEEQLVKFYQDPDVNAADVPIPTSALCAHWGPAARAVLNAPQTAAPFPYAAGRTHARLQQAILLEMARAVRDGRIEDAKTLRADLDLPRGVSSSEGAIVLQSLQGDKRDDAVRLLTRESITWQTTRVRQLFADAVRGARHDTPLPDRLQQELGEAITLANLPDSLRDAAGVPTIDRASDTTALVDQIRKVQWPAVLPLLTRLQDDVQTRLPSLLSAKEKERRERLLLKLTQVIPKEYGSGVRDRQITVPLEYREAVSFQEQAREIFGELAPLWLAKDSKIPADSVTALDQKLTQAEQQITAKVDPSDLSDTLAAAGKLLTNDFRVSLRRAGTTADIVDEVMLEARASLNASLAAASSGQWAEAERLRVEGYTTYDPDLENRLMPRDPALALQIERLLLDGGKEPGVKTLLDRHASPAELAGAYERVYAAFDKATVLLKSGVSPAAAVVSASSIVMREGLEGLLVIIAILAGLRGDENASRRKLFWAGIALSVLATLVTWVLSETLVTGLRNYGEVIEAVTGLLAIVVLLLITNWLFQQVYWRQWVTTLKHQANGESVWQLLTVGFLVGYREGFETVLFLQSLILDAGGKSVGLGVLIGCVALVAMGVAALRLGLKLPYFRILLITALLIGLVLITFVGSTARALQTIGWLPVHRLTNGEWPTWLGSWFGIHNTIESVGIQLLTIAVVLGTWRVARWQAKRKTARRRAECAQRVASAPAPCDCEENVCAAETADVPGDEELLQITVDRKPLRAMEPVDV